MPDPLKILIKSPKLIGVAADHGGYELKEYLVTMLRETGHGVIDSGDGPPKLDDDMNMICLGGLVVGHSLAWKLAETFLEARYKNVERHRRRLDKVAQLEHTEARS